MSTLLILKHDNPKKYAQEWSKLPQEQQLRIKRALNPNFDQETAQGHVKFLTSTIDAAFNEVPGASGASTLATILSGNPAFQEANMQKSQMVMMRGILAQNQIMLSVMKRILQAIQAEKGAEASK
jgi:hypothetical protein